MRIRTFKTALKAASRGRGASHGHPREAKIIKKNLCEIYICVLACIFASNGLLTPQNGLKRRPRGPKIAPGGLQMALRWNQDKVERAYDAIKTEIRWQKDHAKTP